jgi:hypothetical protein
MTGPETEDEKDQIGGQDNGHEVGEKQQKSTHGQHQLSGPQTITGNAEGWDYGGGDRYAGGGYQIIPLGAERNGADDTG